MKERDIRQVLEKHTHEFHTVIPFNATTDKILSLDLSKNNPAFAEDIYNDIEKFSQFINERRKGNKLTYLMGGYREVRQMYRRSKLFDKNLKDDYISNEEPRSLHLGVDIWADAGTAVFAPLGGMLHSFAFNNNEGDYGATIILQHQLDTFNFYTLYGHLSLTDMEGLRKGQFITRGENFGHFGSAAENGNWPPHLHFQLIHSIDHYEGDYPGVCKLSESEKYLTNCPNPDLILNLEKKMQNKL